jgi:hypothetical protein
MAKNDSDLFDRMRQAGLRKRLAKTLSQLGEGASQKAVSAGRSTVAELRSLADEVERRLPGTTAKANAASGGPKAPARRRSTSTASGAARSASGTAARAGSGTAARAGSGTAARAGSGTAARAGSGTAARSGSGTPARSTRRRSGAAASSPTRAASPTTTRAPRGQNKAQILESLKGGPKTASQISQETGIATRTVGSTLSKLTTSGEVVKAQRGYALPR